MDTTGNMLTSILNAARVGKSRVAIPYSRFHENLARLLQELELLVAVRTQEGPRPKLILTIAYDEDGNSRLSGAKRLSRPGQRQYVNKSQLPFAVSVTGHVIVSTPQGLMNSQQARQHGLGGELVCEVW